MLEQAKGVPWWTWSIPIILAILAVIGIKATKICSSVSTTTSLVAAQGFHLVVEKETPTIWLEPGKFYRLESNKPFGAVSTTTVSGVRVVWPMPAGQSEWQNDSDKGGNLWLIGEYPGTVVKIQQD